MALSVSSVAATGVVLVQRGATEAACLEALAVSQLSSALLFLCYCLATIQPRDQASLLARITAFCRSASSGFLYACTATHLTANLSCALWLGAAFPHRVVSELVSLQAVAYICLAVLAASEQGRVQKSRIKMEIEKGEGERHPVMTQVGAAVRAACRHRRRLPPAACRC
jgi:hypothetical protein